MEPSETARGVAHPVDPAWKILCWMGGAATLILLLYSIATMMLLIIVGGQPGTAGECFSLLQSDRLIGLLRLDLMMILFIPLYYVLFAGIYASLRQTDRASATLATALAFAGITLVLATPSVFSMLSLSNKFAAATTDAQKSQLLAAGEAILASDMWHGTGAFMGGLLLQSAAVWISVIMLRGNIYSKAIAYTGIVTHGLDLAHIIVGIFLPWFGVILMSIAGPLYLIWFPLLGRRLLQLGTREK